MIDQRQRAREFVAMVRERYPSPKRVSDKSVGWYCVGVAARYCSQNFLSDAEIDALEYEFFHITSLNDAGRFEEAYQALEDAIAGVEG